MKNSKLIILAALAILFLGCNKQAELNPGNFLKCKIDGKSYSISGDGAYAEVTSETLHKVFGTESMDAKIACPQTIQLNIEADKGVGSHIFLGKTQASYENAETIFYHTNFNNTLPEKGKLIITEKSTTTIKGKFSFSAFTFSVPAKRIEVTEGEFSVTYN